MFWNVGEAFNDGMPTQVELEAELELVFAKMQELRASEKQVGIKGRMLIRYDLADLQKQYDWLEGQIAKKASGGKHALVVSFRAATL